MANDYTSGRIPLRDIDVWIHSHVDELLALDKTPHPGAPLSGFIQVRIYQQHDGLEEDTIRQEIRDYLATEDPLAPAARSRAAG